ncbi:UNVERIFIED_CONTAM: hypothetical protein GTU68_058560 [Idotea baltica]|nr:hypothetical protein [Idotea baltica]
MSTTNIGMLFSPGMSTRKCQGQGSSLKVYDLILCRNGEVLEYSSLEAGHITNCIGLSHTSCSSGEPRGLTHKLDYPLLGFYPQPTPLHIDPI